MYLTNRLTAIRCFGECIEFRSYSALCCRHAAKISLHEVGSICQRTCIRRRETERNGEKRPQMPEPEARPLSSSSFLFSLINTSHGLRHPNHPGCVAGFRRTKYDRVHVSVEDQAPRSTPSPALHRHPRPCRRCAVVRESTAEVVGAGQGGGALASGSRA